MVGQEPLFRVRQKHSRSRTGCLTCRERHVRCDEQRPQCLNCIKASKSCEYAPVGLAIVSGRKATKTKLPGVEAPWQITPQVAVASGDPFDVLPIEMPYKSADVLRFYFETNKSVGDILLPDIWRDHMSTGNADPTFCRGLLLCAAAFFAGHAGGLRDFETVYLHHRGKAIRDVGNWLSKPDSRFDVRCLKIIGTLLLTESFLGNYDAAEQHWSGLKALLELRNDPENAEITERTDNKDEETAALVERYNIFVHYLYQASSHRSSIASTPYEATPSPVSTPSSPPPCETKEMLEHGDTLEAIRLIPYYFKTAQVPNDHVVDATSMINELTHLTKLMERPCDDSMPPFDGNMAMQILNGNSLHVKTLFRLPKSTNDKLDFVNEHTSTYGSLRSARHCYLYAVVGIKKVGKPIITDLLTHISTLLLEDASKSASAMMLGQCNPDMWIWKVFVAAVTLDKFADELGELHGESDIRRLQNLASGHILLWKQSQRADFFVEVEFALERIVWPERHIDEAKAVWNAAFAGENAWKMQSTVPIIAGRRLGSFDTDSSRPDEAT